MNFFCQWKWWWGTSWYCTIYHNLSQLSTSNPNLRHHRSNRGMARNDGARARQCCDNSLLVLQKQLSMFPNSENIPMHCWLYSTILLWTKSLCEQSVVKNSTMLNIVPFGFQLSRQICIIQSMAHIYAYLNLPCTNEDMLNCKKNWWQSHQMIRVKGFHVEGHPIYKIDPDYVIISWTLSIWYESNSTLFVFGCRKFQLCQSKARCIATWLTPFLHFSLPDTIISGFNIKIYIGIYRSRERKWYTWIKETAFSNSQASEIIIQSLISANSSS